MLVARARRGSTKREALGPGVRRDDELCRSYVMRGLLIRVCAERRRKLITTARITSFVAPANAGVQRLLLLIAEIVELQRHVEFVLAQQRDRGLQVVALLAGDA